MSIFGRTSLIIIAISTPALTLGNAGFYYRPSHYSPHNPYRQSNPPERSNVLGGTQLHVFDYKRPLVDTPNQAPPAYAQPVYDNPTVHAPPVYDSPAVHAPHMYDPPAIYAPPVYAPHVYAPPVAYTQPPYNSPTTTPPTTHTLPVTTDQPYNPPAAYTSADNSPAGSSTSTRPSHTPATYTPAPTHEDTPELPEATHEEVHKGVPEDTPEQAHKGTPEDAPEDTPQEAHKGTPEDAHEGAPEDAHKDAPEDTSEDAHKDALEDTPEDAHKDAPEITPEDAHKDAPKDSHKDIPESTPEDAYEEPTPPSRGHGKPSPLPNSVDRRNAPRVSRTKISRNAKRALPRQGHTRRFPFLRKRQQPGQHTVAPVTVNMIPGAGHATSTSSALATGTANALPASSSPLAPGIRIDTSQDALSFSSNPESTMPSVEAPTPPGSSHSEGSHDANLDAGGPALRTNKVTAIASVLSIVIGMIVFITIVKLTSNAMRKRKHPVGLGKYEDHLSSKGLIPEMSDKGHFESHDVIITRPDGSEISPLSSSRSNSPSLRPLDPRVVKPSPSPHPMPTFAPPPVPTSPLAMPYVKLLSPTANLAQQNIMQDRVSEASEIMSVSTTTTDMSERPSASDGEVVGRQLSHRRMRSAPGSVVWSARSSAATGKFTSGVSGSEGYWESIDVCGSESAGRMACRSSRGRSVAMSVMW
ncbi:hypothetical protein EDB86DRAFT_843985 [Lactarius hatsudake]|nr:hypothetical protein EDB86DRAFT_843985 [Lactarius hatsudake]